MSGAVHFVLRDLGPEDTVKRDGELQSIIRKALDVAGRLWKQLTFVRCAYVDELKNTDFNHKSTLFGAHPLHKLGLEDEDDHRLDQQPISILVFPAIKGHGNSVGEKYDQYCVWGKAIVWVGD